VHGYKTLRNSFCFEVSSLGLSLLVTVYLLEPRSWRYSKFMGLLFGGQIPQPCFVQKLWTVSKIVVLKRKTRFRIYENPNTSNNGLKHFHSFSWIVRAMSQIFVEKEKCWWWKKRVLCCFYASNTLKEEKNTVDFPTQCTVWETIRFNENPMKNSTRVYLSLFQQAKSHHPFQFFVETWFPCLKLLGFL